MSLGALDLAELGSTPSFNRERNSESRHPNELAKLCGANLYLKTVKN